MAKLIKDAARDDAEQVLSRYWTGTLPIDPVQIAKDLGINVWEAAMPSDVAGELYQADPQHVDIYLNRNDSESRQTFTCAHEIGHYWDRRQRNDTQYSFTDHRGEAPPDNPLEWYADHFAANLLMPEKQFRGMVDAGFGIAELMEAFAVSRQAVMTRMRGLGLD